MTLRTRHLIALVLLASASLASAETLHIDHTIGTDDDDVLLHHPTSMDWSTDGRAFVLAAGSHEILVFDESWEHVTTFGRRGEGPGEIENGTSLLVVGDSLWVFDQSYVTWFTLNGLPLGKKALGPALFNPGRPVLADEGVLAVAPAAATAAVVLDRRVEVMVEFGPPCNMWEAPDRSAQCGSYLAQIAGDGRTILFDLLGAVALRMDVAFETWTTHELPFEKGSAWMENGANYWTTHVRAVTTDRKGGFLCATREDVEEGEETRSAWSLVRLDGELREAGRWALPEGIAVFDLFVSPRGEVCVLHRWASLMLVGRLESEGEVAREDG